jgi:hypothetical protein
LPSKFYGKRIVAARIKNNNVRAYLIVQPRKDVVEFREVGVGAVPIAHLGIDGHEVVAAVDLHSVSRIEHDGAFLPQLREKEVPHNGPQSGTTKVDAFGNSKADLS